MQIVAVADHNTDSPVALGFSQNGVPVYKDALDVAKLGEQVDIIFDLTNNSRLRQELRLKLLETKNRHTLIATEVVAQAPVVLLRGKEPDQGGCLQLLTGQ